MGYKITVASKTFFVGEYAVLEHFSGIVLSTSPRFELTCERVGENIEGGSLQLNCSLGGERALSRLISKNEELLNPYNINFIDPHNRCGGFGASSARFLMLARLIKELKGEKFCIFETIRLFQDLGFDENNQNSLKPSGADIATQFVGGVGILNQDEQGEKAVTSINWVFDELRCLIFKTSCKVDTGRHLEGLNSSFATCGAISPLRALVQTGVQAFFEKKSTDIIDVVNEYSNVMNKIGLTHDYTNNLLSQMRGHDVVLAVKGCGAMAADVVIVLCKVGNENEVIKIADRYGLLYKSSSSDLSPPMEIER